VVISYFYAFILRIFTGYEDFNTKIRVICVICGHPPIIRGTLPAIVELYKSWGERCWADYPKSPDMKKNKEEEKS
jgi:hypothetical protein